MLLKYEVRNVLIVTMNKAKNAELKRELEEIIEGKQQ